MDTQEKNADSFPGYPHYPSKEDIYNNAKKDGDKLSVTIPAKSVVTLELN